MKGIALALFLLSICFSNIRTSEDDEESVCIDSLNCIKQIIPYITSPEEIPSNIPTVKFPNQQQVNNTQDGGVYGVWEEDEYGLPYFFYTFDEITSPYSSWPNTQQIEPMNVTRKDHFFFFGNERINVKGVDDGYIELYNNDRGATWINYFEPSYSNYAGGFSYLVVNNATANSQLNSINNNNNINNNISNKKNIEADATNSFVLNTAYLFSKEEFTQVKWERKFGIGYYNISLYIPYSQFSSNYFSDHNEEIENGGIIIERSIIAPYGNNSFVIDEVFITNNCSITIDNISHFEFWDINRWQLRLEWPRTGYFAPPGDDYRRNLNKNFSQQVFPFNQTSGILYSQMIYQGNDSKPIDEPSQVDYYPPYIFLASLIGEIESVYLNQSSFIGMGNISYPDSILNNYSGDQSYYSSDSVDQEAILCLKNKQFSLASKEKIHFRYAYGYLPVDSSTQVANQEIEEMLSMYKNPHFSPLHFTLSNWQSKTAYFSVPENSKMKEMLGESELVVMRELKWRSCQLQSSSVFHSYYNKLVIPQGSEYLYLSGGDGAPRDQALALAGNIYLSPKLSKETLELIMSIRDSKTGALWYAFTGYGKVSSAMGLHKFPSDLDIFFFFAITEYLSVTGDWDFLHHSVPFYPKNSTDLPPGATGTTVLDHIKAAFDHLSNKVGLGSHGLIKVREGDWDDGISFTDPDPLAILFTIESGESIPNSQMALYILPLLSDILSPYDSSFSQSLLSFANSLKSPVYDAFTNKWFGRAWLRNRDDIPYFLGNDYYSANQYTYIDLESQPWGLLLPDSLLPTVQKEKIKEQINNYLQTQIGPRQKPSTGFIWPAVSQLLTWAYSTNGWANAAWGNFLQHLYATHANVFPENWVGVWSGPDGWVAEVINGTSVNGYSGGTWYSIVTPMTDFPMGNSNPDGMFMFSFVRLLGVQPYSLVVNRTNDVKLSGLLVNCTQAGGFFSVSLPMVDLSYSQDEISLTYRANNDGHISFFVVIPDPSSTSLLCYLNGSQFPCEIVDGAYAVFSFSFALSEEIIIQFTWS